jgi:serine/threonine-protein kinase
MAPGTAAAFVDGLRDVPLLSPAQHDELNRHLLPNYPDPRRLAKELLQRGWLTPYQVNQLFLGKGAELILGSYIVLERLGEGGTGQVFKARHQKMDRVVELKIIRPELLTDPVVVQRFYREVQVVSQLSHANVVHAYDAGPIGPTHFLAMEYVEGTDLSKLVKDKGPLPVDMACEYIRQAALGLQHVHECGLIHRDVRPSNLLRTVRAVTGTHTLMEVIKLLDLGLARLRRNANGEVTAALTPVAVLAMDNPDYLAPEQAIEFHEVDIRADLYSLGCTFYFLLTGRPPFFGGSMAETLLKHQDSLPPPIERFRPDLPGTIGVVVHRLLAKRPEDRYQTPAELAAALGAAPRQALPPDDNRTVPLPMPDTVPVAALGAKRSRRKRYLLGGAAAVGLGSLLLLGLVFGRKSSGKATGPLPTAVPGTGSEVRQSLPVAKLRDLIRPSPEENRWAALPWALTLWEARQRAEQQGKPILVWETDGHPLGCVATDGLTSRTQVFSDAGILRQLGDNFVPTALDDWCQRRRKDAEGDFFATVWKQRNPIPQGAGRQGFYCLTASGKLLAFKHSIFDPETMRSFMQQGLAEWRKHPEAPRKAGTIGAPASVDTRYQLAPPAGGRIISVYTRILENDGRGGWRRGTSTVPGGASAARDHLWLTPAEVASLVPGSPRDGAVLPLPARVADRLVRFHLVDNTRGEPEYWQRDDVRSLQLTLTVREVTAEQVQMTLEGHVVLTAAANRGYDVRLVGELSCDRRQKTLTRFDVVAVGDHWGENPHAAGARAGKKPLGVVFELARGDVPADLAPPGGMHHIDDYFAP